MLRSLIASLALIGSLAMFGVSYAQQEAPSYIRAALEEGAEAIQSDETTEAWLRKISDARAAFIALPVTQQVIRECAGRLASSDKRKLADVPELCKGDLYYSVQAVTEYSLGRNVLAKHCINLQAFKAEVLSRISTFQQPEGVAAHIAMFHCAGADESVRRGLYFAASN